MGYCISNLFTTLLIWLWQTCSVTLSMVVSIHLLQVELSYHFLWWSYYRREDPSGCRWRNSHHSKVRSTVLHLLCDATTVGSEQELTLIDRTFDWREILIQSQIKLCKKQGFLQRYVLHFFMKRWCPVPQEFRVESFAKDRGKTEQKWHLQEISKTMSAMNPAISSSKASNKFFLPERPS